MSSNVGGPQRLCDQIEVISVETPLSSQPPAVELHQLSLPAPSLFELRG